MDSELILSVHHPFMDFILFERENYFKTELLQDQWTKGGETVEVEFYRRPLSDIMNALCESGFIIQKVLEPMPDEGLKKLNKKAYQRLKNKTVLTDAYLCEKIALIKELTTHFATG